LAWVSGLGLGWWVERCGEVDLWERWDRLTPVKRLREEGTRGQGDEGIKV
jgi:hypothetical protein